MAWQRQLAANWKPLRGAQRERLNLCLRVFNDSCGAVFLAIDCRGTCDQGGIFDAAYFLQKMLNCNLQDMRFIHVEQRLKTALLIGSKSLDLQFFQFGNSVT